MSRQPLAEVDLEAGALLDAAEQRGIPLKAIGGLAVKLSCPSASREPLKRPYKDIDLVGLSGDRERIESLLTEHGYRGDERFNLLNGDVRLYFWDEANDRQLDIFLDRLEMCHTLDLTDRLELEPRTIPVTDLLLSKLQVYETNERDLKDAAALLLDCEIDDDYVARMLAADWGWWRTVQLVVGRLEEYADGLEFERRAELEDRIGALRRRIDAEPKSRRWKLRARIGDRKRWYELPEDDHAG